MNQSLESHISHSGRPLSGTSPCEVERKQEEDFDQELIRRRKLVIRSSWQAIRFSLNVEASKVFYDRLFDQFPMVRSMFSDDMQAQYNKLYQAVSMAVNCLDDLDRFRPTLQKLGIAHCSYGVERAHYEAVTECFVWTLVSYILVQMPNKNAIDWIFELSDSWEWILTTIGGVMADAADEARGNHISETLDVGEKVLTSTNNGS